MSVEIKSQGRKYRSEIGERIEKVRTHLGLNQVLFAKRLGTSQGVISNYEKGARAPSIKFLKTLREVFQVNINWLLTGEGPMFLEEQPEEEGRARVIDFEDERLKQMFEYLMEKWESASLKERRLIELEFGRAFHDYVDWLKKREGAEEKAE